MSILNIFRRLKFGKCKHNEYQQCAECNPMEAIRADYKTLIKCGRRCAYDLHHVVDDLPKDSHWRTHFDMQNRAQHWVQLFAKGNPGKDYRHEMHWENEKLAMQLDRLHNWCTERGLNPPDDRIPF